MADAEVHRDAATQGQAAHVGPPDAQVLHEGAQVLDQDLDRVGVAALGTSEGG